jgi:1,4-alpha-glucan branching enzyme
MVNRFVVYEPAANQVELTGSFTGWQRTPLQRIGTSGYWELTLPVPSGEHRFSYILDGDRQMADPTVPRRENDDFGGENSILNVEARV